MCLSLPVLNDPISDGHRLRRETACGTASGGRSIHHSDQGTQYTSIAFGLRCKESGVRPSMGSVGDACDNAMCESFFATLETELIERNGFGNQAEARMAVFKFIEAWYNPHRRHFSLGRKSPLNYEKQNASAA